MQRSLSRKEAKETMARMDIVSRYNVSGVDADFLRHLTKREYFGWLIGSVAIGKGCVA
jgi:hypothetical protein